LTKEVEEIITELMRTQPEVVIRTALRDKPEIVLSEIIKYEEQNKPALMAAFKLAVKIWARGEK